MYLGRSPTIGTQRLLDSIESQFNGTLTTFDLRYGGVPTYPTLSAGLLVSIGGVLQEPSEAYYVSSDKIVLSEAPVAGTECWILLYSEFGSAQSGAGEAAIAATGEPMGFENRPHSTISFASNTRTFSIAPNTAAGHSSYAVWTKGTRRTYSVAQSVQIGTTTGLYYIYFDGGGALQSKTTYFTWATETPVAYVYWNGSTGSAPFVADERHGIVLDWATHEYLHRTRGAVIAEGFSISAYTTTGNGSADAHAQFDLGNGTFFDEDLEVAISHSASPTVGTFTQVLTGAAELPVFYLSGSSGAWVRDTPTEYACKQSGTTLQYNLLTGSTWSTTPATNNRYVVSWVVATNDITAPIIAILGQEQYTAIGSAEAVKFGDLVLTNFPIVEFRPLWKVIFQTSTSFTNAPNALVANVLDLRQLSETGEAGTVVSDHGLMSGLADDDHTQYLHTTLDRTGVSANISTTGGISAASLSTGASGVGVNINNAGLISGPATITLDPAPVGDDLGLVEIKGNLTVQGLTTTINSTTLAVDDKNIVLGDTASPTDALADGGGIVLKGSTDKTIAWLDSTDAWTLSEHVSIASTKEYRIAGIKVLDATGLGSAVAGSSLTSVGTIGTGTWQGGVIAGAYGGTGVANTGKTITLGGNLTTSGNFALTLTTTAATSVTLPTTGTLIASGAIINADVNASAAIADTKLATIATVGKVSNSATTATSALGINTIVARDGSNNFTAGTITAALTGAASSNVLKAGDTMTGALVMPLGVFGTPSLTFTSDLNTGLFSPGADQVAISTGGTAKFTVGSLDGNPIIENNFPTVRPVLDLAFAATKRLDPRVTFVRATSATYVGGDGLVKTAGVNEPRFDHDPVTGESLGLLVEEARTNLFPQSTNSNHSYSNGVSVLDNDSTIIAPNGTTTATGYTPTSPSSVDEHSLMWESGAHTQTINHNTDYIFSYFVKPDPNTVALDMGPRVTNHFSAHQLYFQSTLGRVAGKVYDRNSTTESTSAFAIPYPNNWWRVYARVSLSGASTYLFRSGVYLLFTTGGGGWTVADSSIGRLWMWGWQIEQGAFPTSYIPTSGSTVTRSADVASMTGTNFSSWYNQSESTFYTNYILFGLDASYNNPSFYAYENNQNYLAIFGHNPAYGWAQASNATAAGISLGGTTTTNVDYKVSFGVKVNDFAASINGSTVSTDTSGNVPTVSQMFLGKRVEASAAHLNGTLKRFTYYPKRLSNTQLQTITL